jgi:hypothetical protein
MLGWLPQESLKKILLISINAISANQLQDLINKIWIELEEYQKEYLEFFFSQASTEFHIPQKNNYSAGTNPFIKELIYFLSDKDLRKLILEIMGSIPTNNYISLYAKIYKIYIETYNFNVCITSVCILFLAYLLVNVINIFYF